MVVRPSILSEKPKGPEQQALVTDATEAKAQELTPIRHEEPEVTLNTGETLRKDGNKLYIGAYPVVAVSPRGLPEQITCMAARPDGTTAEYSVSGKDVLFVATGNAEVIIHTKAQWFSAYIYAKSILGQLISIHNETQVGEAMAYVVGSEAFLAAMVQAKEVSEHFPAQFPDAGSLFAACVCMHRLLTTLIAGAQRIDLQPFITRVMGGQAFLDAFQQAQIALAQLPSLDDGPEVAFSLPNTPGAPFPQRIPRIIIDKKEEAELLRAEVVEQGKNHLQLFLALVVGATTFLALALQPGIAPFTACLLPLAAFSISLKIAAHDLRIGQIVFYLQRFCHSPWEVSRRILFDGRVPSKLEQVILRLQGIEFSPEIRREARKLTPLVPELHSKANRIALTIVDGAAIGVLLVRLVDALARRDSIALVEIVLALLISVGATIPAFLVLQRKRVR